MRSPRWVYRTLGAALAATTLLGACGGDDGGSAGDSDPIPGVESCDDVTEGLCLDAGDIFFDPAEIEAPAGDIPITMLNIGQARHTLLFDEPGPTDFKLEVVSNGDGDAGTVTLEPGEYTFYCDVPGHREAGMEGTLVVQ